MNRKVQLKPRHSAILIPIPILIPMSRRLSNGRSPLVRKQSQITAFFASPSITKNPKPNPATTTTPTPLAPPPASRFGLHHPPVTPASAPAGVGGDEDDDAPVSFRRLKRRVSLGEGPDGDVGGEVEETKKGFRRLRRRIELEEESDDDGGGGDEMEDEDLGKEMVEEEKVELEEEDEEGTGSGTRKRNESEVKKVDFSVTKKVKVEVGVGKVSPLVTATKKTSSEPACKVENGGCLTGDAAERFGKREAEKFRFLHERCKDAGGRRPGDVNYDPKTLFLPECFLKTLSGGQKQWWEFKSKHMDKVLFFKMGKFYELFEMDAHIGAKELDLQYMKGDQPHCGFPEKNFSMNLEKLARKGYRVLVIEQTETPDQLEIRRRETGSKDKVVKREVCAVVTKGTLTEGEMLSSNPDASFLLSLTEKYQEFDNHEGSTVLGVCLVDVSTSKLMLGQFEDDSERQCLCSILHELRPVEIIKPLKALSAETERVLQKHTRSPLVNDLVPISEFWNAEKTIAEIRSTYKLLGKEVLPDVLSTLIDAGEGGEYALSAFGGCIFYLRQALLDDSLLRSAQFETLPHKIFAAALQKECMILDAAALESLEILENNRDGSQSGTLFAKLNHCVTPFGKRLLKSWLARPLYDATLIVQRQEAIAGLKGPNLASALEFRKGISRLPDMERLLARLFSSYETTGRNAKKVVLYEDAAKVHLKGFTAALRGCESMVQACSSFGSILDNNSSGLLKCLLTPGKGFPDIFSELKHFKDAFDWLEADQLGRIIPHPGGDIEYDSVCKTIKEIESNLKKYLNEQRKLFKDTSVNYVTIGKDSYLLELPEILKNKIPPDYELQSSKKGYCRYWTPKIKKWLVEHSLAEAEKESKLKSIIHRLIRRFSEDHNKWRRLVATVAELDVLISMVIASDYHEGPICRPTIRVVLDDATPSLSAKSLGHPLIHSDTLGKGSFVPNDVGIGGAGHANFVLLTGPNMGGKSTFLRQICLAVILAQIGADVPAEKFELSPVDRIFVRMGAKDQIMAGQSTFLTELSETASMLSCATHKSLVALDELGRGTSTSDGQAIAGSVLEYFIQNTRCRGLFSTHYHQLAVDYEKNPKVLLCHMACQVGKGANGVEEVIFLYRLTLGSCPKSYGVNVARLAGLPSSVLQKAMVKSQQFEAIYGKHGDIPEIESSDIIRNNGLVLLQDILDLAVTLDFNEKSKAECLALFTDLQRRAKLLTGEA